MLAYFPFEEEFDPGMGMRLLKGHEPLCEVDLTCYHQEIELKEQLLQQAPLDYFRGGDSTTAAQWDVLELVTNDLARQYPEYFSWIGESRSRTWHNRLTGASIDFPAEAVASLPCEPLDWIGRQIQEDLVLLSADPNPRFVGGQLCFANGWSIQDRIGKSFAEIHRRTPGTTMPSVQTGERFLDALKPGKTFWRMSWNFKLTDQMDMTPKHSRQYKAEFARRAPALTREEIGASVFIRIERQTFTRLPSSGYLLFGIHTYNSPVGEEAKDPRRARCILNVIRGAPRDVKDYKAITPIEGPLTSYLESRADPDAQNG